MSYMVHSDLCQLKTRMFQWQYVHSAQVSWRCGLCSTSPISPPCSPVSAPGDGDVIVLHLSSFPHGDAGLS